MRFYFFIIIFMSFISCRTANVLVPICIDQNIQNEDERIDFSFDLNESFWDMTIYNNSKEEIKVDYDKIRLSMSHQKNMSGSITKTLPERGGILYILPDTKNSKLLYSRYSIRRNLFTPKEVKNKGFIDLSLYVPVEYANETIEYRFNFIIRECGSEKKYRDDIYD